MARSVIIFSLFILALLLIFHFSKYALFYNTTKIEVILAIIAVIFFNIGLYINKRRLKRNNYPTDDIDDKKIKELQISPREYEVLQKIAEGLSNKEIGDALFLSESTVKTHVSNILTKLNAKRRTHAIKIAKQLKIL